LKRAKKNRKWIRQHIDDPFVKRARKEGYRARAAYKLQEIDGRDRLFGAGMTVVDLGAAPGSWSQYARRRLGATGRLCALDLLPIEPIPGVELIQGDFTEQSVLDLLLERLGVRAADLVISDMAPNISGVAATDQAQSILLAELVLDFSAQALRPDGSALVKTFQGAGYEDFYKEMRKRFRNVSVRKPRASRPQSREVYLLGRGFRTP
jgi:23S rRNA (uridine2552-2'-O)-methyltransferase